MDNPLDNFIGQICADAYCGFAGHLKIKCCSQFEEQKNVTNQSQNIDWVFETFTAAWRFQLKEEILTGSYEKDKHNDTFLIALIGKKIIRIEKTNKTDVRIFFEDDYLIETFNQGLDFHPLEIYNDQTDLNLILTHLGEWEEAVVIPGFTGQEELESNHSEITHKRWENMIPEKSLDNKNCDRCAYFLTTSGHYYFWDYGICSHEKSGFDGKIVGTRSICDQFSTMLIPDE